MAQQDRYHRVTFADARKRSIRRMLRTWGLLLLPAIVLAIAACGGGATSELPAAPDFEFILYQGENELGGADLSMSDLQGKPRRPQLLGRASAPRAAQRCLTSRPSTMRTRTLSWFWASTLGST